MSSVLRGRTGYWEACLQLQTEENPVNIKQLWVKKWLYGEKTIESALARRTKAWIVASKFENVSEHIHVEIWYKHDISLYYFYTLRAESV